MLKKKNISELSGEHKPQYHHHELIFYLLAIGSGTLFLFLLIAVIAVIPSGEVINIPQMFFISTLCVMLNSILINRISLLNEREQYPAVRNTIAGVVFIGLLFLILQLLGWRQLWPGGEVNTNNSDGIIYVISLVHLIHVMVVIGYSVLCLKRYGRVVSDPVSALMHRIMPYEKVRLGLFVKAWHYLDAAWVVIFLTLFFLQ